MVKNYITNVFFILLSLLFDKFEKGSSFIKWEFYTNRKSSSILGAEKWNWVEILLHEKFIFGDSHKLRDENYRNKLQALWWVLKEVDSFRARVLRVRKTEIRQTKLLQISGFLMSEKLIINVWKKLKFF